MIVKCTSNYHLPGHDDLQRLNKELLVVRGNDSVMNDILADLTSNPNPSADELQLLRVSFYMLQLFFTHDLIP